MSSAFWSRLVLVAAGMAVVAIYGLIACTADSELGSRSPSEAYYNRLADGLMKGRLSLDLEAPRGLAALANPYDRDANRPFRGDMYSPGRVHDLSYYRGRLYLYFSVIPAVLLFLPYHGATGGYLSHQVACFAFSSLGFAASALLMNSIRRLCFPQAGLASAALATIYLGLVPMIPIVLQRPDVWEVPITASYAFWMLSLLVLWAYLNGPPQAWGAALCLSACVGLAVGCRPNTLLGASILVVPLYRMARSAAGVQGSRLSAAMAALILPIAAIGACLAAYNYCRFGDAMEFGQKYQLNGELATSPEFFRARFIGYNFRIYFLHYQDWGGTFPFVRDAAVPNPPVGHAGVSGAVGVLTLLPFTIFAAAAPLGFQEADTRHVQPLKVIVGAVALLFASILGPLLLFFGAVDRYEMEFAPAMVLLAVIGQFALESRFAYSAPRSFGVKAALYLCAAGSIAFNLLTATSRRAGTLSFRGNLAMDRGQWEEAGDLYRQSLRLAPGQLGTRVNLGLSYVREGDLADACAAFGVAAQEFPDSADARLKHGWSLFKLGRLEEAEAECRVALQEDPRSAIAREALRQIEEARAAGRGPAGHIP